MTLDELRRSKKQEILRIATGYGASNVRVFGSVARGESSPASDIDFMVDHI
jgi:predicted nucleotidyltransferase